MAILSKSIQFTRSDEVQSDAIWNGELNSPFQIASLIASTYNFITGW